MTTSKVGLLVLLSLYSFFIQAAYLYPTKDPFLATVSGTPDALQPHLSGLSINEITLKIYQPMANATPPSPFVDSRRPTFKLAWQKKAAPLIFIIAGTGARYDSSKAEFIKKAYYRAGFHVIQISSPTSPDFMMSASRASLPGASEQDAQNLYQLMQASLKRAQLFNKRLEINDIYLAGYSLGALNAAFVGALDDKEKKLGFQRILLINPPVYLERSIVNLDKLTRVNIPGIADTTALFNRYFDQLAEYFRKNNQIDIDDGLKAAIGKEIKTMSDAELGLLIGVAFRFSIASLVFTSDVMNQTGLIAPKGKSIGVTDSRTPFFHRSMHWSFQEYITRMLLPALNRHRENQGMRELTLNETFSENSLPVLKQWLAKSLNIGVMHNADDLIIDQSGLTFIYDTFGKRARIYPYGGHMGNLQFSTNVEDMVNFIKTGQFPDDT